MDRCIDVICIVTTACVLIAGFLLATPSDASTDKNINISNYHYKYK